MKIIKARYVMAHFRGEVWTAVRKLSRGNCCSSKHCQQIFSGPTGNVFKQETFIFSVLEARGPRSGCQHGCILVRALSLAGRPHLLAVRSQGKGATATSPASPLRRGTNPILRAPPSRPLLTAITSQKPRLQISSR